MKHVLLSALSALLARVEAAQLVSPTLLKAEEFVNATQTPTKAAQLVSLVIHSAMAVLLVATQTVRPVLPISTLWKGQLIPAWQAALTTQPTTSWMTRFVRNATLNVQHAVGLKTTTATPVSPKKYSTRLPNHPNTAHHPVGLVSMLMVLTVEVSLIEIQLVCADNC